MNMPAKDALAAAQAAMQGWLLHGDPAIAARIHGENVSDRLRIYADAYRLRLVEVLGNDFPVTKALLGDDAFDALGSEYLHAHPSTHPSARHFGHAFAAWLHTRGGLLHEVARFEWMQGECFDAADAPTLGIDHVAALPTDAWPALHLRLHPAARLLTLASNAADIFAAHAIGIALPELRAAPASVVVLWRNGGDVQWRWPEADEALALHAIAAGEPFARICERLDASHGDGALRAASLLKRWLADGLLAAP